MHDHEPSVRSEHFVLFYETDDELFDAVDGFIAGGGPDAMAIIVATEDHRDRFARALPNAQLIDARTLLSRFNDDGVLDPDAFEACVGELIRLAGSEGRPVRVFGEMVALLWNEGLVAQAIELESFWNALAETLPFALLCAYPSTLVLDSDEPTLVNEVCQAHRPVRSASGAENLEVRAFAAVPHAIAEARRFVASKAEVTSPEQLDKLLLIVSELATNAVQHAGTPFVVEVVSSRDTVCVAVRDRSKTEIGASAAPMESECGRGLGLVDALADSWGVRWTKLGKVVWAEVA
ncbi:MAG: MEDS domain-containing protein [Acidimicrobiales bacterium]|nr:MEDS domain-containing protein [Acidimicrobiales bacterium]